MDHQPARSTTLHVPTSANRSLHVTYLTTGLNFGGAETQLVRIAIRMKERGSNVSVVSMLRPLAYVEDLETAGIRVYTLGMSPGSPNPSALFRLAEILKKEQPQVLHAHMVHANLLARLVRPIARVPVVICTAHSTYESATGAVHLQEMTWREWAYRLTDPLCNLTTQISRAGIDRYIRVKAVPSHKIRVVPNGVDVDRFRRDTQTRTRLRAELGLNDHFVWLAVGRFEAAKDYPNLLRAFARLFDANTRLLIAGQGPLKETIEELTRNLGLDKQVRLLGVRKDIPDLMNAADAYVMSSFYEGLPMVLLEAAATCVPIVATDVGGNREIVIEGKTGYLVPPRDTDALAEAMGRLMRLSKETRILMGEAGRTYTVAHYSLEEVLDRWEELYIELLNKQKGINA